MKIAYDYDCFVCMDCSPELGVTLEPIMQEGEIVGMECPKCKEQILFIQGGMKIKSDE